MRAPARSDLLDRNWQLGGPGGFEALLKVFLPSSPYQRKEIGRASSWELPVFITDEGRIYMPF